MKQPTIIVTLVLIIVSCKNSSPKIGIQNQPPKSVKSNIDSIKSYNELANMDNRSVHSISKYNTDDEEIENIERPQKTIIQNLEIDTSNLFGIWTKDPNGPHADFWLTSKSFYVVDYDGNGDMPYKLEKDEITIYYNDFIQKGKIISTTNDSIKIIWEDSETETKYVKFEN